MKLINLEVAGSSFVQPAKDPGRRTDNLALSAMVLVQSVSTNQENHMRSQVEFALANPVYDPVRQITARHYWRFDKTTSACLTVNIGQE